MELLSSINRSRFDTLLAPLNFSVQNSLSWESYWISYVLFVSSIQNRWSSKLDWQLLRKQHFWSKRVQFFSSKGQGVAKFSQKRVHHTISKIYTFSKIHKKDFFSYNFILLSMSMSMTHTDTCRQCRHVPTMCTCKPTSPLPVDQCSSNTEYW